MENIPKVGIGVIIRKDNKVLLGKRKNAHGEGSWCFAGGKLEYGETWEQCSTREVTEEVGLTVGNIHFSGMVTNDVFQEEEKHYITIFMICDYVSGVAKVLEPEKAERWEWFSWEALPKPLFLPIQNLLKQKFNPFEI
jgi:8-oxo-dGTP diphosphatase